MLFESRFDRECDRTVAVLSSYESRLNRIMARDHLTQEAAEARLKAQKPDEFYKDNSHETVYNDGDLASLAQNIESILEKRRIFL